MRLRLHARCSSGAARMTRTARRPQPQLSQRAPPFPRTNRGPVPHGRCLRLPPAPMPLPRLAYYTHAAGAHVGIFATTLCLAVAALPGWLLRVALIGAVGTRTVAVVREFEAQIEGREDAKGSG